MRPPAEFTILDADQVEEIITALARRLAAELGPALTLIGIRRRGVPIAQKLKHAMARQSDLDVDLGELTLKRYADDLSLVHEHPHMEEPDLPFDVEGRTLVLVDDVAFTGRTLIRAGNHLLLSGADRVFAAILCDRGAREAPLAVDFAGLRLDVGTDNVVDLHIPPYEDDLAIVVKRRGNSDG